MNQEAANLYEYLLLNLARQISDVIRFINYRPGEDVDYFRHLAPDFELIPQEFVL